MTLTNAHAPDDLQPWSGTPDREPRHPESSGASTLTLADVAKILRRRRNFILATGLISALTVAVITAVLPRSYTSSASFVLQGNRGSAASAAGGLASQLGLSIGTGDAWQQPNFYADLVQSREILDAVANDTFCAPCHPVPTRRSLAQLLDVSAPDSAHRIAAVAGELKKQLSASVALRTGLVTLEVTSRSPLLAEQIAQKVLDELTRFSLDTRRSQASSERQFAQQRMREVEANVRRAEAQLEDFYRSNRTFMNSPELRFYEQRLLRDVALQQDLYTALARSAEQARLDEVRDMPSMSIVDHANLPLEPNPRRLPLRASLGGVLGLIVGAAIAIAQAMKAHQVPARAERPA